MTERWLPVVGYEGLYEVSDLGRVRRAKTARGLPAGRILKSPLRNGYPHIGLYGGPGTRPRHPYVHQVVAAAFLGPCPTGYQVNHKDGCKENNRPENLEYTTPKANTRHAVSIGLMHRGERSAWAKLTEAQVRAIKALLRTRTQASIARQFGVDPSAISGIAIGRAWKHIK